MKQVIVTADDFGAAVEVNEAVEQAHTRGILTAASLMVTGLAFSDAVERAQRLPSLGTGLHIVLVDGVPALPAAEVPDLIGPDGRFHPSMLLTSLLIAFLPRARAQMRAEIAAQFARFAATGLPLDHVNAHKHFHLHPIIADAIVEVGRDHGSPPVRVPFEPGGNAALVWWARLIGRRLQRRGLLVNDRVSGLAWTGAFDATRMARAMSEVRDGLTEFYCHPASSDHFVGHAPGYRYRDELSALVDPVVCEALAGSGAVTGPFRRFAPAGLAV